MCSVIDFLLELRLRILECKATGFYKYGEFSAMDSGRADFNFRLSRKKSWKLESFIRSCSIFFPRGM